MSAEFKKDFDLPMFFFPHGEGDDRDRTAGRHREMVAGPLTLD